MEYKEEYSMEEFSTPKGMRHPYINIDKGCISNLWDEGERESNPKLRLRTRNTLPTTTNLARAITFDS